MKKEEIYLDVYNKVIEITGVEKEVLNHSQCENGTDARYLLVNALNKLGMTDTEVSVLLGKTRQSVGYLRHNYKKSDKWMLANQWKELRKWLESEYFSCK